MPFPPMELLNTLGSVLGIGLLSGFRLYATVLGLGLGIRFGFFELSPHLKDLAILADAKVLIVAAVACAIEFFADKIPWLDSIWDSFHTFIRPVGAALIATAALGDLDPTYRAMLAVLTGSVALAGHTSKAATRLAANHSPEPLTNVALSLAEDLLVPAGLWFVLAHPFIALTIVAVFLTLFCWLSPKVFRLLCVELTALGALFARWFSSRPPRRFQVPALAASSTPTRDLVEILRDRVDDLPARYAATISDKLSAPAPPTGVKCAATRHIGLRNSIGYLCLTGDNLAFVTRRWFTWRVIAVPLEQVRAAAVTRRLLLDDLCIDTAKGRLRFDLFKSPQVAEARSRVTQLAG
jgi:hypothetical protein